MSTYENADFGNWTRWDLRDPNQRYAEDNPVFATSYKSKMVGAPNILRGYMRAADPNSSNSGGWARLFFQYNPSTIVRTTELQTDVLSSALQSPTDTQGVGQQGFSFALLFDRQGEVASNMSVDPRITRTYPSTGVTVTDTGTLGPNQGVLADLAVFDKLTGIGNINAGNQNTVAPADNAAIMASSFPVRVIFSPQMMVEGYVQSATVTMQKFNHMMVPVFAEISVTMLIRYWGSAKLDTGGFPAGDAGLPYTIRSPGPNPNPTPVPSTRGTPTVATPRSRNYDLTPIRGPF